ncbi:MAG: hypothetical protein HY259_10980 [Chloroflexi bacterium]|nr:hypothetical protein [Chloroflexota bacterium]
MLKHLRDFGQGPILAFVAVIILATVTFSVFKASRPAQTNPEEASAQAQSATTPMAIPANTRVPTRIPTRTPLPTIPPEPPSTPRPIIPTPAWTAIPATITDWISFTGTLTGTKEFSFSYPAGWLVSERSYTAPAYNVLPQIVIEVVNYAANTGAPEIGSVPGGAKFEMLSYFFPIPANGTPIAVGPQQLPGVQIITDGHPAPGYPDLARTIAVYFTAGGRQWLLSGYLSPPQDLMLKNADAFYRFLGGLRYDKK